MSQRMIYQTEETREKIISRAEKLFIEGGFAETQMKDIASAVGVSRNTLYRYYQDKYDLGLTILVRILKRKTTHFFSIIERIDAHEFGNIREGLYQLKNAYIDENDRDDDRFIAEFDAYYSGSRIPENFSTILNQHAQKSHFEELKNLFEKGQAEGSIRKDLPTHYMVSTFFHSFPAFYHRLLLRENALIGVKGEDIAKLPTVFFEIFLDGLKPTSR